MTHLFTRSQFTVAAAVLAAAATSSATTAVVFDKPYGPTTLDLAAKTAVQPGPPGAASLQANFVRVVKAVRPAVVQITTGSGLGSGVIFDSKGDIVTNAHVVGSDTSFTVSFSDGRTAPATLVGVYPPDDLAVIKVAGATGLSPAKFGNSSTAQVGNIVVAIGNPLGLSSSVTEGIVSFNGRAVDEGNGTVLLGTIQTSAAINPGNSGGALVNLSGRVIGIPTLAASTGTSTAQGLGFAIPSNTVTLIAPQLISKGKVTTAGRAALGVTVTDGYSMSGEPIGVLVTGVMPNGPAAKAGITPGDLIIAVDAKPTSSASALQAVLSGLRPGYQSTVTLANSQGQTRSVKVVLADLAQL